MHDAARVRLPQADADLYKDAQASLLSLLTQTCMESFANSERAGLCYCCAMLSS